MEWIEVQAVHSVILAQWFGHVFIRDAICISWYEQFLCFTQVSLSSNATSKWISWTILLWTGSIHLCQYSIPCIVCPNKKVVWDQNFSTLSAVGVVYATLSAQVLKHFQADKIRRSQLHLRYCPKHEKLSAKKKILLRQHILSFDVFHCTFGKKKIETVGRKWKNASTNNFWHM